MSGIVPPILPLFVGSLSSPNVNKVDTMPTNTDPINTMTTKNVSQSIVDENLHQLLDSRGGSHVTNVPAFDKEDFTSWKVRFLVFLDGLEPYLLKTLEDGPFVPMPSLSTSKNALPKRQNQWSNAKRRLANQDKRLKSIIISCLPNDVMKSANKCKTAKEIWNDLILAHEGPSDTRDTKIAALRLKFNAFKSLEGKKVNRTFTRLKCLLNDLENNGVSIPQAEVNVTLVNSLPRKWLSMNQTQRANNSIKNGCLATLYGKYNYEEGLIDHIYDSAGKLEKDKEFVSLEDEGTTKIKAFMAIVEDEPSVGKADARSGQWVDITMKKRKNLLNKFNLLKQELSLHKSELWSLKNGHVVKSDQLLSEQIPKNIVKALGGRGTLPPLPKLIGAAPAGTSNSLISMSDLTLNIVDLTLNTSIPKKTKPTSNKVSLAYVIKKKTENKSPTVLKACSNKNFDSSTEQLLLTLMEEVKGLKRKIKFPSGTSPSITQSTKKAPMIPKPFKECKYCRFSDHHSDNYEYYPGCEEYLKRSIWYLDSGCSRHMTGVKQYLHRYSKKSGPKVLFGDESSSDIEGYGLVNCNRITFTRVAYVNGTDISNITRKPSKTGKHVHEERKSTREAKDSEPKPEEMVKP
ncbi:hypothetical protein Tco_0898625, partial [Tanacetum coccineum]